MTLTHTQLPAPVPVSQVPAQAGNHGRWMVYIVSLLGLPAGQSQPVPLPATANTRDIQIICASLRNAARGRGIRLHIRIIRAEARLYIWRKTTAKKNGRPSVPAATKERRKG